MVGLTIDFHPLMTRLVLEGLVTQTILPLNQETRSIKRGDRLPISFNGLPFKDFWLVVRDVTVTSVERLSNVDAFRNGFSYKPFLLDHLGRGGLYSTVLKLDFVLEDAV